MKVHILKKLTDRLKSEVIDVAFGVFNIQSEVSATLLQYFSDFFFFNSDTFQNNESLILIH